MARVAVFIYLLLGFCLGTQASHSAWGAVALEGAWSSGTTHIAGGSSNTQRILVFVANTLNWQQSDITAVSYGGQALTQRVEVSVGTGTALRTEIWTLNEAGIQAASGSTFTVTYALSTPYGLNYYAATLSGVDQTNPITGTASTSNASSVTSLSTSVTGSAAGFIVAGVVGATSNTASFSEPGWSLGGSQSNSGSTGGVGYISITSGGSKSVTGVMGSSTSMALATLSLNETASLNPSSFTATASSNTSINLSWVRGGGSTTGYRIAYQSGASVPANCSTGTQVDLGAVASSQVTGLVASTQYSFRLCSYNASGTLSSGVTATATTQASAPAAPSEVLYPAAVADSSTQITLSWQNTSNNGNAGFRIAYQIGGTAPASCTTGTQINAGLTQNYSITGLTPLTQYSFRICAYNGTPTYTAGATANATTQATASTGVVNAEGSWIAGVSHSAEGAANTNRILIFATGHEHWDTTDLTAVSYGGRAMTQLLERQVGNSWDAARTELWYLKESDIQGANSGTFILTYSNGVPSTPLYSSAFFSNVDQTTPFPSSSSTDDASAALTTVSTNITRTKGGMSIACASSGNSGTFTANNSWVLGSTTTLGSMAFGVSRISSATSGTDSASFSLTGSNRMVVLAAHLGIAPPPNPISFTATSGSDTSIDLAWTKSGGTASGTRIAYQSGGTAPPSCTLGTQIDASTASSYTITGLTANTQYGFRICAYNTATAYSSGQTASITTLTTPPAAPNDLLWLSSSVTSDTAIVLSWTHGGGGTTGYRIAYQLGGTAPSTCLTGTQIAAGLTTSRTVTGLSPNTQYSFRVCGQNGVPVYSAGVTTSNTTNPTPPSNSITALGSWVTGLTHSSEGTEDTDRMLVVVSGYENYGTNDISTISYGGQVLTQRVQTTVGSSPGIGVEIWTLGEAGIQAASSSTIAVTYASGTPSSVTTASAFFKGFHPSTPIGTISSATNDTAASFLSTSVTGEADGLSIFGAQTGAATGMFSIGNSWTLGSSQNSGSTSMSVGHHPTSSSGPDMVDVSFAGSDRMALVAISLKAAPAAPPNVTSLSATANSDTQITLNWTSGGGSTTGYRIAYQSGGTAPASCSAGTQIDNGVSASYVLTGLTASTQYSFRVCAYNSLTRYSSGVTTSSTTAAATANWTGATSTNWFTASNWSPASVPNASRDCVLAPQVRSPTIAGTSGSLAQCRNLTLSTTLTVDGSSSATELRISGNLTSTGTITVNQGVVAITESGSASAQTVTLNGRLGNLLVRKALGGTISFPSGTTEIDSLSFASGAVATINLTSGRTLRLRNDLTLPANTTLKLLGGSQLEFESGRTFTVSGGTFQVSGDVDDLMTTGLQQGIVTTINNTGTWTFNSTSGTVNLLGFVLDRLAASGLNIAGSTTLSNLGGGHFENLSASASGKAIQLNTTGSVPSSSIYLGFNYVSAPSNGYLLASSTSTCSTGANHTIVFSEWYGNFYNPDSKTPNPNTKVVDTAPSCDIDISLANTPVSLAYLRAKSYDSAVLLEWETGSESAHQGFNVYRSENPSAGYSQLNSSLVRNILSSTSTRGVYRFLDSGTANGSIYYYLIEDVAVNGTTTRHGPVRAAPLAELGSAPALDGTVNEGLAGTGSTNSGGGALTNPGAEDLSGGVRVLAKYGSTLRVEIIPPQETYLVSSWNSAYSTVAMQIGRAHV